MSTACTLFVRVRPLEKEDAPSVIECLDDGKTVIANGKTSRFAQSVIAPTMGQTTTFDLCGVEDMISDFLNGIDVNFLTYGQTGTGKTHTLFGPPDLMKIAGRGELGTALDEAYGLFPRAVFRIVDRLAVLNADSAAAGQGPKYVLSASAVELQYVPQDLLFGKCPCYMDTVARPMRLVGQTTMRLSKREHALRLFAGLAKRSTRSTRLNDSSSRSHCFVALKLFTSNAADRFVISRFQFVDMCGSERLDEAHMDGNVRRQGDYKEMASLWEGLAANWSLMHLSQCVRDIVDAQLRRQRSAVSFRKYNSELVSLLEGSLRGTARTALVVTLSQHPQHAGYSLNALDFGATLAQLRLKCRDNPSESISDAIAVQQRVHTEAEAALAKGVKGKYKEKRLAQSRSALDSIALLRSLLPSAASGSADGTSSHDPLTFSLSTTLFPYELCGVWDAACAQEQRYMEGVDLKKEIGKPVAEQRKEFSQYCREMGKVKLNKVFRDRQHVTKMHVDTTRYGGIDPALLVLVHTDGSPPTTDTSGAASESASVPALVYFHGGGTMVASAQDYSDMGLVGRYAIDLHVIVFNVDYRLSPEVKVPGQIKDGAAVIRYVAEHATELGIDATRIAAAGESGGAYVATGACMLLAEAAQPPNANSNANAPVQPTQTQDHDAPHLHPVKLLVAIAPQTGTFLRRSSREELLASCSTMRLDLYALEMDFIDAQRVRGGKVTRKWARDPRLYPNLMSDTVAAQMPHTVVMTSEFDMFRADALELAEKLSRCGRLLDLCVHPGTSHCWYMDFQHQTSPLFWKDTATIFEQWL